MSNATPFTTYRVRIGGGFSRLSCWPLASRLCSSWQYWRLAITQIPLKLWIMNCDNQGLRDMYFVPLLVSPSSHLCIPEFRHCQMHALFEFVSVVPGIWWRPHPSTTLLDFTLFSSSKPDVIWVQETCLFVQAALLRAALALVYIYKGQFAVLFRRKVDLHLPPPVREHPSSTCLM